MPRAASARRWRRRRTRSRSAGLTRSRTRPPSLNSSGASAAWSQSTPRATRDAGKGDVRWQARQKRQSAARSRAARRSARIGADRRSAGRRRLCPSAGVRGRAERRSERARCRRTATGSGRGSGSRRTGEARRRRWTRPSSVSSRVRRSCGIPSARATSTWAGPSSHTVPGNRSDTAWSGGCPRALFRGERRHAHGVEASAERDAVAAHGQTTAHRLLQQGIEARDLLRARPGEPRRHRIPVPRHLEGPARADAARGREAAGGRPRRTSREPDARRSGSAGTPR